MAKQQCISCHFFSRVVDQSLHGAVGKLTFSVSREQRDQVRRGDWSWVGDRELACAMGVWDEAIGNVRPTSQEERTKDVVSTSRRNTCFYRCHRPEMLFQAAKLLQEREEERRKARLERWLAWAAIVVATGGVIVDAVMSILCPR